MKKDLLEDCFIFLSAKLIKFSAANSYNLKTEKANLTQ